MTRKILRDAGKELKPVESLDIDFNILESKNFTVERPLRIVFAYKGVSWKTIQDEIEKNDWENLFDIICILNRGIFINQREDKKLERLFGEYTKVDFLIAEGKSASLGLLYYHLISYGNTFIVNQTVL